MFTDFPNMGWVAAAETPVGNHATTAGETKIKVTRNRKAMRKFGRWNMRALSPIGMLAAFYYECIKNRDRLRVVYQKDPFLIPLFLGKLADIFLDTSEKRDLLYEWRIFL